MLLAHGADVNAKGKIGGYTPLYWAVNGGHQDIVGLLLANGADVNIKDDLGQTSLHETAFVDNKEAAEILIAHGANIFAKDDKGMMPCDWAEHWDSYEVGELLRAAMCVHYGRTIDEIIQMAEPKRKRSFWDWLRRS